MRYQIESKLQFRKHGTGGRDYYDCPFCTVKDPESSLVVTWDQEQFICNHMDSCGKSGHISELARDLNIEAPRINHSNTYSQRKERKKVYEIRTVEVKPVEVDSVDLEISMDDRIKQLEYLFNPEDKLVVCRDANYFEQLNVNLVNLENEFDNFTHVKVNAGGPKASDIDDLKYTLVECDNIEDLTEQKEYMLGLNLPITTLTWSGNKSLHAIVRIDAKDRKEYDSRVKLLHKVCKAVGFEIDKTIDPCRYTRLAGAINPKTQKVQKLLDVNIGSKSWNDWYFNTLPGLEKTADTINTNSFESRAVDSGFSSGFLTHDYNDSGLKSGGLTLLTGRRNQGKTTFARQIMVATAKQELNVFAYMGEGEIEREKGYLERLVAKEGEINSTDNGYGRTDWYANDLAKLRYSREISKYIDFYNKPLDLKGYVFDSIFSDMTIKAKQGTVLFVIDNMMKLTADQAETLKAQQMIVSKLKQFAVNYKVHIILICHPRKDGLSISGAMEQENTADTILKFQRVVPGSESEHLPAPEMKNVTAMVYNEKVRDGGVDTLMYMEFDPIKQANIEIVYIPEIYRRAQEYREQGFYSREMIYV